MTTNDDHDGHERRGGKVQPNNNNNNKKKKKNHRSYSYFHYRIAIQPIVMSLVVVVVGIQFYVMETTTAPSSPSHYIFRNLEQPTTAAAAAAAGLNKTKRINTSSKQQPQPQQPQQLQKVYIALDTTKPKSKQINAMVKHTYLEGIEESTKLVLTADGTDPASYLFVDTVSCSTSCLQRQLLARNNNTTASSKSKIFIVDGTDGGYRRPSALKSLLSLANTHFGYGNVYLATRQHYVGRKMNLIKWNRTSPELIFGDHLGVPRNFSYVYEENESYGIPKTHLVQPVHFGVRTDLVNAIAESVINHQTYYNISYDTDDLSIVLSTKLPRPKDVISFWDPDHEYDPKTLTKSQFRCLVSRAVLSLRNSSTSGDNSISATAGIVGHRATSGRQTVHEDYVNALLEHKIVVVAQRDLWEGHYRLLEGLVSGALVLHDPMHPLPYKIKDGTNIVIYYSLQDLKDKILYYLKHDEERKSIARNGYMTAMKYHRAFQIMERYVLGNWSEMIQ
jgi:hypothetical protein